MNGSSFLTTAPNAVDERRRRARVAARNASLIAPLPIRKPPRARWWRSPTPLSRCRTAASNIERISGPFIHKFKASPAEYDFAIAKGWLWLYESGTFVRFTDASAALFA